MAVINVIRATIVHQLFHLGPSKQKAQRDKDLGHSLEPEQPMKAELSNPGWRRQILAQQD
jgi:hypothetical protein